MGQLVCLGLFNHAKKLESQLSEPKGTLVTGPVIISWQAWQNFSVCIRITWHACYQGQFQEPNSRPQESDTLGMGPGNLTLMLCNNVGVPLF